ncbi:cation:proton antiporter domain-containing protein [Pseudoalteromonas sp. G4]|uniref:cation:proton antiporter domain-containing protein n=1 Tax=Pseudoalteromonas sp. G4 TaxID=2992761 RepID=UPI00237E1423|nr:cation:proton antiporter [Pseudoalteromonas sp. G4]MDE3271082.1 cation:proton antiporter [Pseudoalteromonas sp. G4]
MHNEYTLFVVITCVLIAYSLFAKRIHQLNITGPMFMLTAGLIYSFVFYGTSKIDVELTSFQIYIELTLALILFSDAAKTKLAVLTHSYAYPLLLLLVALPITFALGSLLGSLLFTELPFLHIALLAIILTPTDAALSSNFIENSKIPEQTREAVNVESGLNDGLAVPIFLLLLYSAINQQTPDLSKTMIIAIKEIGIATLIAGFVSPLIFKVVLFSEKYRLYNKDNEVFIFVAIAVLIYLLTQSLGGSGFFAAFIAGLLFDIKFKSAFKPQRLSNAHALANTCALIIWFVFANFAFTYLHNGVELKAIIFAILALTIMRILPVLLSLLFTALPFKQRILLAWFGPRGLASVVFTLILIQELTSVSELIIDSAILTIILSVIFHGLSAKLKLK